MIGNSKTGRQWALHCSLFETLTRFESFDQNLETDAMSKNILNYLKFSHDGNR